MALSPEAREAARLRKRAQRERDRKRLAPRPPRLTDRDDDPSDPASEQLAPAGIQQPPMDGLPDLPEMPPTDGGVQDLMTEQAIWVHRRRQLTEIEIRRRKGELIEVEDAQQQTAALARRIRSALSRAPSLLPADLAPDVRAASVVAIESAIKSALAIL